MSLEGVLKRPGNVRDLVEIPERQELSFDPKREISQETVDWFLTNLPGNMDYHGILTYEFLDFSFLFPNADLPQNVRDAVTQKALDDSAPDSPLIRAITLKFLNIEPSEDSGLSSPDLIYDNIQEAFVYSVLNNPPSLANRNRLKVWEESISGYLQSFQKSYGRPYHPNRYRDFGFLKLMYPDTYEDKLKTMGIFLDKEFWQEALEIFDEVSVERDDREDFQTYWQMAFGLAALSSSGYRINENGRFELVLDQDQSLPAVNPPLPERRRFV